MRSLLLSVLPVLAWVALLAACESGGDSGPEDLQDASTGDRVGLADAADEQDLPRQCPDPCDDGNPCTVDSCDTAVGQCATELLPAGLACDDGNACTHEDTCNAFGLCTGSVVSCDDMLSCTADACDPAAGCVNQPVADPECVEPWPLSEVRVSPYLQDMRTDHVVVMWETLSPCAGEVLFGTDPWLSRLAGESEERTIHEVSLDGLAPGTVYSYRVRPCAGDALIPDVFTSTTFPGEIVPFRFAVWGDSQSHPEVSALVALGIDAANPVHVMHVGDVVGDGDVYESWAAEYLLPITAAFASRVPSFVAIGNHEKHSEWFFKYVSQPPPENWFALTVSHARFVALDVNTDYYEGSPQWSWLLAELASPAFLQAEFRFLFFHNSLYSEQWNGGGYTGDPLVALVLMPVLSAAGFDVLFCGHTHDYERGYLPDGKGMHYVITGGGGGELDIEFVKDWPQISIVASEHHFVTVDAGTDKAVVTAWLLDGSVLDKFEVLHDAVR